MAFLVLDGEACQRCRGDGGRGAGVGVEVGPLEAPTWPRGLPVCASPHVPVLAHQKSLSLGFHSRKGGLQISFPDENTRIIVPCTVEKTHNTDLIYGVGCVTEDFYIT